LRNIGCSAFINTGMTIIDIEEVEDLNKSNFTKKIKVGGFCIIPPLSEGNVIGLWNFIIVISL
jgi:hypothetical protein